jgi:hypothetical protein
MAVMCTVRVRGNGTAALAGNLDFVFVRFDLDRVPRDERDRVVVRTDFGRAPNATSDVERCNRGLVDPVGAHPEREAYDGLTLDALALVDCRRERSV